MDKFRKTFGSALAKGPVVIGMIHLKALPELDFVRVENFVFGHLADEGYLDACAGPLLRYRKQLGLQDRVLLFTDVKKKHSSHALTSDVSVGQAAAAAEFFLSDGVVVTGQSTGDPPDPELLAEVRSSTRLPVLVGSGSTPDNAALLREAGADAFVVGSAFKAGGRWDGHLDPARVRTFLSALR